MGSPASVHVSSFPIQSRPVTARGVHSSHTTIVPRQYQEPIPANKSSKSTNCSYELIKTVEQDKWMCASVPCNVVWFIAVILIIQRTRLHMQARVAFSIVGNFFKNQGQLRVFCCLLQWSNCLLPALQFWNAIVLCQAATQEATPACLQIRHQIARLVRGSLAAVRRGSPHTHFTIRPLSSWSEQVA